MAKQKYYSTGYDMKGQMVQNDPSALACMPTETILKQYPSNPAYYTHASINDQMSGIDKKSRYIQDRKTNVRGVVE